MISVIIPVYKNTDLFIHNLKLNLPYLVGCEIIIVNDDPRTDLKKYLVDYPQIQLIENNQNLGFGKSINTGVKEASKGQYVMLLNSDVLLMNNNYIHALELFKKNPKLFAVSFSQLEKDKTVVGKNSIYWSKGFFQHRRCNNVTFGINGWAEGGSCIIDKNMFLQLSGFDDIYSPFYWEDIDLSYRAWKQGYEILFDPEIQVIHHHESTIGKYFGNHKVKEISYRNQLLFIWKNIKDRSLILNHIVFLLPTVIAQGTLFIKGFISAFKLLTKLKKTNNLSVHSDKQILLKFNE